MTRDLGQSLDRYAVALEAYLVAESEEALSSAYELGRQAMNEGLGVLDMVTLHRAAVARATNDETSARAATFFMEALSPFEMALGGYRASNAELKRLNDSLRKQKS